MMPGLVLRVFCTPKPGFQGYSVNPKHVLRFLWRERGRTGSRPDLSSRAGDTGRIEGVVVHRTSGQDAFNSALVVSQVMQIGQIAKTAGESRVAGGVGLGKVESGGTPARHTLSVSTCARSDVSADTAARVKGE
jgi:hypothetical protein